MLKIKREGCVFLHKKGAFRVGAYHGKRRAFMENESEGGVAGVHKKKTEKTDRYA